MIIFLLNLVFGAIITVLNLVTWLIFSSAAHVLVLAINGFKLPGQGIQSTLELLGNWIRVGLEFLLNLVLEVIVALISSLFDAAKQGIIDSVSNTGSVLGGLMEELRGSLDDLIKDFAPQVFEGLMELVTGVMADSWSNCKDAIAYVIENAWSN